MSRIIFFRLNGSFVNYLINYCFTGMVASIPSFCLWLISFLLLEICFCLSSFSVGVRVGDSNPGPGSDEDPEVGTVYEERLRR